MCCCSTRRARNRDRPRKPQDSRSLEGVGACKTGTKRNDLRRSPPVRQSSLPATKTNGPAPRRQYRHGAVGSGGFRRPTAYRPSGGGRPLLLLEGSTQLRPFRLITASWVIGAYSMVFGAMLVGLSLRLRKHRHTSDEVPPR